MSEKQEPHLVRSLQERRLTPWPPAMRLAMILCRLVSRVELVNLSLESRPPTGPPRDRGPEERDRVRPPGLGVPT